MARMIKHLEMISQLKTAIHKTENQPGEKCAFKHDWLVVWNMAVRILHNIWECHVSSSQLTQ